MTGIPEGFEPHFRKSPLTDPWEPLYSKRTDDAVILGVRLAKPHTNARGFAHGGLISALADNAMGLSCGPHLKAPTSGLVTISLSVDFMGRGEIGQWLEFRTTFVKAGRTLCFTQCFVTADDKPIAKAAASFHVLPSK
ncbi:MAG TPA: PaaI family thioesterase [Rhizomicrobium sp.]|jgi:uncharacterized protein (TIGR00369 family)|nr:PaaI family thioesterase [Rhizomicrobium sp.]